MRIPKYRLHKPSGRAVFQYKPLFGDRRIYLPGAYGSDESRRAYQDYVGKVLAYQADAESPRPTPHREATIGELCMAFLDWSILHHGKKDYDHFRAVVSKLNRLFEHEQIAEFGPLKLKAVRQSMLPGWSRSYANHQVNRLRFLFKWGVENEWLDGALLANLQAVAPLRKGKTDARETEPIEPVPWESAANLTAFVVPMLAAMMEVQYLTGMRSDELTCIKPRYIDMSGESWIYQPTEHKTAWRGKRKIVCIGPRAQSLLRQYMPADPETFIFGPQAALAEHAAARAAARKTKAYGKALQRRPQPRKVNDRYDYHSYHGALLHGFRRWAKLASGIKKIPVKPRGESMRNWLAGFGISYWHPHQLRHTRGTMTRAVYGIEGAQAQLGNTFEATEIYAEKSLRLALRIAKETG